MEHAKRLRAASVNHPQVGLDLVWERLEECYGSPEAVKDALFKRVDNFPRITAKRLYEVTRTLGFAAGAAVCKNRSIPNRP